MEGNIAKAKRAKGEEYTSPFSGKCMPSRKIGDPCTCKKKCFLKFTDTEKEEIFVSFHDLANKELQDAHLFGFIKPTPIKRRCPRQDETKQRQSSYMYIYSASLVIVILL